MVFSSIAFIYYFLPASILAYFIAPNRLKNLVLVVFSLFFYFFGEPKYTALMLSACAVSWGSGTLIEKHRGTKWQKPILLACVSLCLSALLFFKYADFIIGTASSVINREISPLKLALPIGISFYTFQALSYAVDVYRGDVKAQRSFINFCTYLTFFPQLIAGPVVRYSAVAGDIESRAHSSEKFASGVRRFIIGLGKKVLIANVLGELTAAYAAEPEISALFTWIYAAAFTMQIYFDFSGYSDMAIGMGRMFGFNFPENFDYPLVSKSVAEFWRRWHISLGTWFRDYVYFPMGGNRVKSSRWLVNILVVWALSGLWHGAAWSFAIWGLYFALFLIIERFLLKPFLNSRHNFLKHIYVLVVIMISFVIFGSDSLPHALTRIGAMFGINAPFATAQTLYHLRSYAITLAAAAIGSTAFPAALIKRLAASPRAKLIINALEPAAVLCVMALCTAFLVDGSFNPFLYFRF